MRRVLANWKLWIGLLISLIFLWLAFRKVELRMLWLSLKGVDYRLVVPVLLLPFASNWIRAWRWQYLLAPIRRVKVFPLFAALNIGYMANTFLPAHLGEFVRAYVLSKKKELPWPQVFASIVVERILDMLTLVILMAVTLIVFPFPPWVKKSGVIMLVGTALLSLLLVLMKWRQARSLLLLEKLLRPLPDSWRTRMVHAMSSFLRGLAPLGNPLDYAMVLVLSFLIWGGYVLCFGILFKAFGFVASGHSPLLVALVLQVITTIAVVVPSSPGYVGTYHFLCQESLRLFGIPVADGLGYAIVMHAITFLPVLVVGLVFLFTSGLGLSVLQQGSRDRADL